MTGTWALEHHTGSAADFHALELPDPTVRTVWWFEVTSPALVLGSTQSVSIVDPALLAPTSGVEVVHRRSGGGAVWLEPDGATWIDVILPRSDWLWLDDVSRSALWLGEVWVEVLTRLGCERAVVHEGPMDRRPGSELICFAGLAPGEVTVDDRKVVGISQRRSRHGARFQCAVQHSWEPRPLIDSLALADADRARLSQQVAHSAVGVGKVAPATIVDELLRVLATL